MKEEQKDWRNEVLSDIQEFVSKTTELFKSSAAKSFTRAPLIESHDDVHRGYSGAIVDLFFFIFSRFVGDEEVFEEALIQDLRARFVATRAEEFEKKTKLGQQLKQIEEEQNVAKFPRN